MIVLDNYYCFLLAFQFKFINNKEVILASFKKKDFKEDLGNGVYAHKVLEFDNGKAEEFWHTFPDYKSRLVEEFFLKNIE